MSALDDLVAALDEGRFDSALDGLLGSLDKEALLRLMEEMNAQAESIPDQGKRHLFKNGIASIQMAVHVM